MNHSMICALLGLSLTACGASAGSDATGAVCEMNPEPNVRPQKLSANGQNLNGIQTNGVQTNGIQANGINMQGISLQGISTEGGGLNVGAKVPAVLADGKVIDLMITSVERSAAGDLAYYRLDYEGQNICGEDDKGLFLPGVWDERGARQDARTIAGHTITATYSCAKGMLAKCVAWGYAPSKVGSELHETCTRMGRADYCGSGVSFTKNGTLIDLYDTRGIQTRTSDDATLVFEAGWGPNGAVCVNRARFDAHTTAGEPVLPSCWSALPKCGSFAEAQALGATMGNSSRVQSRTLCSDESSP